jgi:hypothetical protein
MKRPKIPIFCIDGDYNEEEDLAFFNCPYSGINTFSEDWVEESYPAELIYFAMGLAFDETEYVNPEFQDLLEEYNEAKMEEDPKFDKYDWFYEYLATKLPKDKQYYILQVDHPEGVMGDWNIYVYEGIYKIKEPIDEAIEAFTKRMLSSGPPQIISKEEQGGASTVGVFNIPDED